MQWNVSQLLKATVGTEREYEIDELPQECPELASPLVGEAKLMRTADGILVTGHLSTSIWCDCSRCLEHFAEEVDFDLIEEFFPTLDVNTGVQLAPRQEDVFTITPEHILNLAEPARQYALLRLPLKPLCEAACQGLCPQCGTNLNQQRCTCAPEQLGSRWAGLEALRKQLR